MKCSLGSALRLSQCFFFSFSLAAGDPFITGGDRPGIRQQRRHVLIQRERRGRHASQAPAQPTRGLTQTRRSSRSSGSTGSSRSSSSSRPTGSKESSRSPWSSSSLSSSPESLRSPSSATSSPPPPLWSAEMLEGLYIGTSLVPALASPPLLEGGNWT